MNGSDGLGQSQVSSWLAQGRHKLIEAARGRHDDCPARTSLRDAKAVRDPPRQIHQRAGPGAPRLVSAEPFKLTVDDEERLVAFQMYVRRRREPGWHTMIDNAQPALAVGAADLFIVSVFRNQNGCPSSAATTKPLDSARLPAFIAIPRPWRSCGNHRVLSCPAWPGTKQRLDPLRLSAQPVLPARAGRSGGSASPVELPGPGPGQVTLATQSESCSCAQAFYDGCRIGAVGDRLGRVGGRPQMIQF